MAISPGGGFNRSHHCLCKNVSRSSACLHCFLCPSRVSVANKCSFCRVWLRHSPPQRRPPLGYTVQVRNLPKDHDQLDISRLLVRGYQLQSGRRIERANSQVESVEVVSVYLSSPHFQNLILAVYSIDCVRTRHKLP